MADSYLENKFEALRLRREKEAKARQATWKKRMDAYRKKLEAEQKAISCQAESACESSSKAKGDSAVQE